MNRTRIEPLGVPGAEYSYEAANQRRRDPGALDRWIVRQITHKLGDSPVRLYLWNEPEVVPRDGDVAVRFMDSQALWQVLLNPELHFGDLYSAGRIQIRGDLLVVLQEAYRYTASSSAIGRWLARGRRIAPDLSESKRNIHHHYDIGNDFYTLWLDREALQYTCAYYAEPTMTIEQAQQAKMHHVCRKLQLAADQTIVEAGGGWGGFAIFMAKNYGAKVRSFNISKEQVAYARSWAAREGVLDRVEFVEDDYRNLTGTYDRFVSIGMLEHVGAGNYKELVDRQTHLPGRLSSNDSRNDGSLRAERLVRARRREHPLALREDAGRLARALRGERRSRARHVR